MTFLNLYQLFKKNPWQSILIVTPRRGSGYDSSEPTKAHYLKELVSLYFTWKKSQLS